MTINLTELEELARKAIDAWPKQAVRCSLPGSVPTDVVNLWCVSSPSTVLALCKVVRAAEYLANEARGWGEYGELLDCVTNRKCLALAHRREHSVLTNHPSTYRSWSMMKNRCTNPNASQWRYYGGRGVKVCDRWMLFENFFFDMGVRPDGTSLDRIDANGDYCPENCRWLRTEMQSANRRSTIRVLYRGEMKTLREIASSAGCTVSALRQRLCRTGSLGL